eukprot:4850500-Pleurochrysis_carterae.AAC.4
MSRSARPSELPKGNDLRPSQLLRTSAWKVDGDHMGGCRVTIEADALTGSAAGTRACASTLLRDEQLGGRRARSGHLGRRMP